MVVGVVVGVQMQLHLQLLYSAGAIDTCVRDMSRTFICVSTCCFTMGRMVS